MAEEGVAVAEGRYSVYIHQLYILYIQPTYMYMLYIHYDVRARLTLNQLINDDHIKE